MKMNKINGYTEDEAKNLVRYICEGRKETRHMRLTLKLTV